MDDDELTVEIIRRNHGEQDPIELYLVSASAFEALNPAVIWDEFSGLFSDPFTINEHKRYVSSGASGFWWELVVEAWDVVPEAAAGYGLGIALDRLADRLGVRDVPPLDRDRALNTARWAVLHKAPSLQGKELGEPYGEESDQENQRWTFKFRPGNGFEYTAEVGWHSKVPGVVRIGRTQIDPNVRPLRIVSGSIVKRPGTDDTWVVTDITGDGLAVLRRHEDVDADEMVVDPVIDLKLVGYLEHLDGWIEESHGVWRKID